MSRRFHTHDTRSPASRSARACLRAVLQSHGRVPNLLGMLAESPMALKAYVELSKTFATATLSPLERQVVMMTVTRLNASPYCMAGHSAISEATGVAGPCIEALRQGRPLGEPRLEALRRFTESTMYCRGRVDPTAWAAFDAAGYGNEQALEVLVGIALKVLSNYVSRMTGVALDEGFRHWAWPAADSGPDPT